MRVLLAGLLVLAQALFAEGASGQAAGGLDRIAAEFDRGAVEVEGESYPYRLMRPLPSLRHEAQPLVVFLHGAGERGSDNRRQLTWLPTVLAEPRNRERLPCFLLAVQCPTERRWAEVPWGDAASQPLAGQPASPMRAVQLAIHDVLASERIDRARIYLTGLSMGGYGSWDLAAREPDRFAAVMPVCGGGDERIVRRLLGLPIMVWHGADDRVVPPERSRVMVAALREFGVPVEYSELPGVGHDAWKPAYGDGGGLAWLFSQDQRQQQRGAFATWPLVPPVRRTETVPGRFVLSPAARVAAVGGAAAAAAARTFARALLLEGGPVLEVVDGEGRAGDVAFVLARPAGAGDSAVVVEIDDRVTVTASTAEGVRRGAAIALQAVLAWPGAACPRGLIAAQLPPPGRIDLGAPTEPWSGAQLLRLIRLAWLFGADEITGVDPGGLASTAQRAVRDECAIFGVTIASQRERTGPAPVVFEVGSPFSLVEFYQQPWHGPGPFEVRLVAMPATVGLRALHGALPAAVTRASAADGRGLALGQLAGRLGAIWRRASVR